VNPWPRITVIFVLVFWYWLWLVNGHWPKQPESWTKDERECATWMLVMDPESEMELGELLVGCRKYISEYGWD
jgi:hypothetical protein